MSDLIRKRTVWYINDSLKQLKKQVTKHVLYIQDVPSLCFIKKFILKNMNVKTVIFCFG